MKGSSALWKWTTVSAAVSAAILLSYSLRPLQMVVCTQEISSSCWVNVIVFIKDQIQCVVRTLTHRDSGIANATDGLRAITNSLYILSHTLHFHCSEKKETTKLVVYLICISFSKAWNQTVPGTSKSEICLFWHMTIAYESQAKPVFTTAYSLKFQSASDGNLPSESYRNWMEDFFPGSSLHELKLNDYLPVLLPQHEHGPSVFLHTCFSKQR